MSRFKIVHDRKKCIGCSTCIALCPENWFIAKDGKASPKKTMLKEIGCNYAAADNCPVHIIKIVKLKKK